MPKKALIVDNDFFFLEFLTELLEKRGHEVIKAGDGKEGLIRLNEGRIDFLFMEIILPKIDGRRLIRYVRNRFPEEGFPIVVVSAYLVEQMDSLGEIGADYYIAKGAMEKMGENLHAFMEAIEKGNAPDTVEGALLLEPGQVYPRQATAQLLDTLSYHEAVTRCAGTGIIVLDTDAKILYANTSALEIMDDSLENLLNSPITGMVPAEKKDHVIESLKEVVRNNGPKKKVLSIRRDSGNIRLVVSGLKFKGRKIGWVVSLDNIEET